MIRKALLIGAPGKDLPGVTKDIANFKDFLLSGAGGAWESKEIDTLMDPSRISGAIHYLTQTIRLCTSLDTVDTKWKGMRLNYNFSRIYI